MEYDANSTLTSPSVRSAGAASRSVFITGASSGLGREISAQLANRGFRVFAGVRSESDAAAIAATSSNRIQAVRIDITDDVAIRQAADFVRRELGGAALFALVNNAGIAEAGPLLFQPRATFRRHLDTNLIGTLAVTQAFAPLIMGTDRKRLRAGRIVIVSSIAGRIGIPYLGAYSASKHALEGLSECLRRETMALGIEVVVVAPGAISDTRIWEKGEMVDLSYLAGTPYEGREQAVQQQFRTLSKDCLTPAQVADVVFKALTSRRPKTRYSPVAKPIHNWLLPRLLPRRVVDSAMRRQLST